MPRRSFTLLAGLVATAAVAAEPAGQTETIQAERQRVEQLKDDMTAILDTTPGGQSVAQRLRAQRRQVTERMVENALPDAIPATRQERDPFVVTPQLRARSGGGSVGYIKSLPGMTSGEAPPILLKGLAGPPGRRVALLEVKDQGLLQVKEGETFQTSGGQAFRVKSIRGDAVVLETGHAETEFLVVR